MTLGTLFHGFGGFDIGAHAAGLTPAWGVEYEDDLATVARDNGLPCMTADVLTVDYAALAPVGWLHASPPCPNFSVAKTGGGETESDLALADAVCRAIEAQRPLFFSLENVRAYVGSESLNRIVRALLALGYDVQSDVLCAADYGVPQTRDRLVLVASREQRAKLPAPTHAKEPGPAGLFGQAALPWNGWYAAVEDLLPGLPDSKLAAWQEKRLPDGLRTMLLGQGGYEGRIATASPCDPALTVTANTNQNRLKAVLVSNAKTEWGDGLRAQEAPAHGVTSQTGGRARALLVSSNSVDGEGLALRHEDRPALTVDTKDARVRAIFVGDQHRQYRDREEPACTNRAGGEGGATPRAIVLDPQNAGRQQTIRDGEEPLFTVPIYSVKHPPPKAVLSSPRVRVVQLTPRCLARFQTFPDPYRLPSKGTLACKGVGNAVPSLLAQRTIEANR